MSIAGSNALKSTSKLLITRVIHVASTLDPSAGGTSRSITELAIASSSFGECNVVVWTPKPQQTQWTASLKAAQIDIATGDLPGMLQRLNKHTVIHDHGVWLPVNHMVAKLSRRFGIARMVSPRGMLEPWALNHRRWKKRLAWALYQRRDLEYATGLHATAQSEAENFQKLGLTPPIFVVPNGVQIPPNNYLEFKPRTLAASRVQRAVFLSRIHPKKGLPMLAEAWRRVRPTNWKMVVIGPDECGHLAEIKAIAARLEIAQDWEFLPQAFGEEKWRRLAEADVMILPTYSENFGNAVAEALMAETPVITTTGAPWQGLRSNRCGWWISPTIEGVEEALRSAFSKTPQELREMGRRGREWARVEFAWPNLALQMKEVYEWMLNAKQIPECRFGP